MSTKKVITNITCISFLFLIITGCAKYVDIAAGSDEILLVTKKPVGCISKGTVDVTALAQIAYVERSEKNINMDLLQLAKNSAIKVKANTIIKSNSPKPGEATFSMYKCYRPWTDKK
jgi:hypothetical protein